MRRAKLSFGFCFLLWLLFGRSGEIKKSSVVPSSNPSVGSITDVRSAENSQKTLRAERQFSNGVRSFYCGKSSYRQAGPGIF